MSHAHAALPPAPGPSAHGDPFDAYIAGVLEIIPDVEPTHVRGLVEARLSVYGNDSVVEHVLHALFEDASYPRTEKSTGTGKRKRTADEEAEEAQAREKTRRKLELDYASCERVIPGGHYVDLALSQLLADFPLIPKPHVRSMLFAHRCLYAPTHLFLAQEANGGHVPYKRKTVPSRVTGKERLLHDAEFEKERAWLVEHLARKDNASAEPDTKDGEEDEDEECEDGIECGCCFSKFAFDKMVQCPETHLFCRSCCRSYAENQLGQHNPLLGCMDQSGCKELFPESELARFLPEKLLALYHRLKQQKEIAAAGLEGLEECPFCEYKVVIENAEEKLFRCESTDCGIVSCRACKKEDHLPKSCKEVEEDKHLSIRHAIEEAMTKALMRNCPKCAKGFVKEHGCNKMTCPNCGTLSCYICRQVISGYEHFGNPPPYTGPQDPNKCNLWDPIEQRGNNEVRIAAEKAIQEYRKKHPEVSEEALKIDFPEPVRNAIGLEAGAQGQGMVMGMAGMGMRMAEQGPPAGRMGAPDMHVLRERLGVRRAAAEDMAVRRMRAAYAIAFPPPPRMAAGQGQAAMWPLHYPLPPPPVPPPAPQRAGRRRR
ncbi:hypothetical protein K439DRAFT_1370428 [Ramaria rubella]|nr:hypothetical protein K439DRAFT_1370428 [Ramaria rubella]